MSSADARDIISRGPVIAPQGGTLAAEQLFQTRGPQAPEDLADERIVGLYFSASWCPPCRSFTPQLAQCYDNVRRQGRDFEVVFCSWDNDRSAFERYAAMMPWPRLPFQDPRVDSLRDKYGVRSIPTLVLVNARDGSVVTNGARMAVPYDLGGRQYPWQNSNSGGLGWGTSALMTLGAAAFGYWYVWPRFMK